MAEYKTAQAASVLGDPRFFERAGPFTLAELEKICGGAASRPEVLGGRCLTGVAALQTAGRAEVAVLHNPRYAAAAERTEAGVVIVSADLAGRLPPGSVPLVVADPHQGWARIARLFHPLPQRQPGVHPTAIVDASASVDPSAAIGPYAVIGARVQIAASCEIGPGVVIGDGVVLGQGCRVGPLASISHAILGERVYIYPGARIGQDGFGFAMTATGFLTVPQLGRVMLHDDVEVGANSTIDRGASHDTVIGAGTRIDNLIQIGHNVQLGRNCVMAGQSGIAGSVTLEDFVQVGAQAGLAGHFTVGARARIGAQAGVMSDVPAGADVIGSPALPVREYFRNVAVLRRLARRGTAAPVSGAPARAAGSEEAAG
jgi:UDP-3-O-[3-hydroxymyristoyl] glucosamine N-acyltransferase